MQQPQFFCPTGIPPTLHTVSIDPGGWSQVKKPQGSYLLPDRHTANPPSIPHRSPPEDGAKSRSRKGLIFCPTGIPPIHPPYRIGRPRRMEREAMSKASQEAAREWTRVHDRSGAADLPRDCPRSASVRLCSKNLNNPIAAAPQTYREIARDPPPYVSAQRTLFTQSQ